MTFFFESSFSLLREWGLVRCILINCVQGLVWLFPLNNILSLLHEWKLVWCIPLNFVKGKFKERSLRYSFGIYQNLSSLGSYLLLYKLCIHSSDSIQSSSSSLFYEHRIPISFYINCVPFIDSIQSTSSFGVYQRRIPIFFCKLCSPFIWFNPTFHFC